MAVGNPLEDWSPRLVKDVVSDIVSAHYRYVVGSHDGTEASLKAVRGPFGWYERSLADKSELNNLSQLNEIDR